MRLSVLIASTIAVLLLLPSGVFAASRTQAEYLGGTSKAIPVNTVGVLETASGKELQFHYGQSVYSVPLEKIVGAEVTGTPGKHIWRVPVPHVVPGKSPRLLTIRYREGETGSGTLTFRGSSAAVTSLADTLTRPNTAVKATATKTSTGEEWWGDVYWRTTRNKDKWPSASAGDTTAGGTK